MNNTAAQSKSLVYLGPTGAGLGFKLSGITTQALASPDEVIPAIRQLKESGEAQIIFVDEVLAAPHLADLEKLNEDTVPAIVLLPNPTAETSTAAAKMQNLIIRAVGSDIVSSS